MSGFFSTLRGHQKAPESDFLPMVDKIWNDLNKYAGDGIQSRRDSTVEFVVSGWIRIKAEQHQVAKDRARKSNENLANEPFGKPKFGNQEKGGVGLGNRASKSEKISGKEKNVSAWTNSRDSTGWEGLSLDALPNINVSQSLNKISKYLIDPVLSMDYQI
jgi:hypothetical protein